MRPFAITFIIVGALVACDRRDAAEGSVDTSMVFVAAPAPAPADSAFSRRLLDSVNIAVEAYSRGRITADSAAKVMMDYINRTHRPLNIEIDERLRAAFLRQR
jgi:hypothetical protein